MALKYWAFIYLSPGFNPESNTVTTESPTCRFKTIGIDVFQKEQVLYIAKKLVAEGVQTIELCGGFGPTWVSQVSKAINNQVPVGSVMYGPEFRQSLLEVMQFNKN